MSSREIAALTGKEHKNVRRDIENMLVELLKDRLSFEHIFIDSYGREQAEFRLDRKLTLTLVSGYSTKLRNNIIERLDELEEQAKAPAIPTHAEALRLAADQIEKNAFLIAENKQQAAQIEVAAPKVEVYDRIIEADGAVNLQTAGKVLGQPPNKFIQALREKHWIFRRAGSSRNSPHVDKINAGYMSVKIQTVVQPDGSERIYEQPVVTPKGLAKLTTIFAA